MQLDTQVVMSETDDLIREQRERFNREFDRIGCLALVVEVLVLLAVAGALLATSNVIDLFRGK